MTSFDERAREWDTEEHIARAIAVAKVIRSTVPIRRSTRAVELGAGTGLLGLALIDALPYGLTELVLTDPSAGMIEVAAEKVERRHLSSVRTVQFEVVADRTSNLGTFDLVLSLLMLHHIKDSASVFRAAHDLLRPGGWIALADLDPEDGSFHDAGAGGIHHRGFDRDALRKLASDGGFGPVSFKRATEIEREGRLYPLFLMTAQRPPWDL